MIWNVGGEDNKGEGSNFDGKAVVNGKVRGETSDVQAGGSLYAQGAVAIGSIGNTITGCSI